MAFNLQDLLNERSKVMEQNKDELENITLDLERIIPCEENFYSTDDIKELKQSIALLGVLQPLLVTKQEDKYLLLAGHRRRLACLELVKDGMEEFKKVPCVVKRNQEKMESDETLDQLMLIFANGFREKTEWEKMEESLRTEKLISELKNKTGLKGRVRTILAEFTGIKESQLGRYKAISNNLSPELMETFKEGRINVSTAYEVSRLEHSYQKKAFDIYKENNNLNLNDVKELRIQEENNKPIEGQMSFREVEEEQNGHQEPLREELINEIIGKEKINTIPIMPKEQKEETIEEKEIKKDDGEKKKALDENYINEFEQVLEKVWMEAQNNYNLAEKQEAVSSELLLKFKILKEAMDMYRNRYKNS